MADSLNFRLNIDFGIRISRPSETIGLKTDVFQTGLNGMENYTLEHTDSSPTPGIGVMAFGNDTIAATTMLTINFATQKDSFNDAVLAVDFKVMYFLAKLVDPDGTKTLRFGPNGDADAVRFGIQASVGDPEDAYITKKVGFLYEDPYAGSAGDSIKIYNASASSVTVNWCLVGLRA